jgi:hypothetical protein
MSRLKTSTRIAAMRRTDHTQNTVNVYETFPSLVSRHALSATYMVCLLQNALYRTSSRDTTNRKLWLWFSTAIRVACVLESQFLLYRLYNAIEPSILSIRYVHEDYSSISSRSLA